MMNYSKEPKQERENISRVSSSFSSRIVRVSRAFGGKDRHSKVSTVRGLRDRRVRLSVSTAIQLYDLQDRLGLNQPSKVVDWLLDAAKKDIDELPPLPTIIYPLNFGQPLLIEQDPVENSSENRGNDRETPINYNNFCQSNPLSFPYGYSEASNLQPEIQLADESNGLVSIASHHHLPMPYLRTSWVEVDDHTAAQQVQMGSNSWFIPLEFDVNARVTPWNNGGNDLP